MAKKIRGFPDEIVIIDTHDYHNLDERTRFELFEELQTILMRFTA